ncbi:hypothetical protein PGTUg99_034378 [Puccinia graminis f. sp. tritici]|uniref:Uncharacterized protein n=1 Tax=Puccinia graminis f. sp. tritici TaxID=56615 RepID=A0A5B0P4G1_PUCGR|nr:hypothetical protein PGTUg99_034378 [Puccinia graminis f. sp. tritici]
MDISEELPSIPWSARQLRQGLLSRQPTRFRIDPRSCFSRSRSSTITLANAESSPEMNPTGR